MESTKYYFVEEWVWWSGNLFYLWPILRFSNSLLISAGSPPPFTILPWPFITGETELIRSLLFDRPCTLLELPITRYSPSCKIIFTINLRKLLFDTNRKHSIISKGVSKMISDLQNKMHYSIHWSMIAFQNQARFLCKFHW